MKKLTDSATLPRLAAGIGLVAKKVIKEPMTSNLMNYVKFTVVIAASIAAKRFLKNQKIFAILKMFFLFKMNKIIKLEAVCAIIETTLIFYLIDIVTGLRQKFHDRYSSLIFFDNGEDLEDSSPEVAGRGAASDKVADK